MRSITPFVLLLALSTGAAAQDTDLDVHHIDHLPPVETWNGASIQLMLEPDHEWATDFEKSGGYASPDYETTMAWARRLVDAADELAMFSIGDSPQGRPIEAIVASGEGAFTFEALRASDRPLVFAHAGIHSGEIDGKDAGFMLLRDMTVLGTKRDLLDRVNLVLLPIFSVDGHERRSEHNRMNQRGPTVQGWRTNARNLNLNRDYAKARALETQHLLRALEACDPDLYLDLHVTDGADYQYDITYGFNGTHGWSPSIAAWLDGPYRRAVDRALDEAGHVPGPLIFTVDRTDITRGMYQWTAGPRYSNGYGDARHLPTVLLENHSLKPYRRRVLGTYVFLEANLRAAADHFDGLREAIAADRAARPQRVHLDYARSPEPLGTIDFRAIRSEMAPSDVTGTDVVRWTGEPYTVEIPILGNAERATFVDRPTAYWIPAEWNHLAELLDLHGVDYERIDGERSLEVQRMRFPDATMAERPYEGMARVDAGEPTVEIDTVEFRPGSLRVPTDQDRGTLAMLLLEPQSPDGVFQWGFMLEVLQRTEYFESYAMEPMAREMLAEDPALNEEFEERLQDPEFAENPRARLDFFYERTPYFDRAWKRYPIARELD
jgi:hypothetical protein